MDLEFRLAALSNLMDNKSEAVERRLGEELRRVENVLTHGTDYDELSGALKTLAVLAPKFHGAVLPLLTSFVRSVPARTLTQGGEPFPASRLRYWSAGHLIREAIDVTNPVHYVHIEAVVDFLLELSRSSDEEVRAKAKQSLEALSQFDLNIFYGERALGAQPQASIVTHLARLDDDQLVANAGVILGVLRNVLSPSMEGHAWTHSSVTISRGAISGGWGIAEVRADAISLLKRMYPLNEAVGYRRNVLSTFDAATRRERPAGDPDTSAMFERDALAVLDFLGGLVGTEALPLVQAVEHQAYWDYYHAASPAIKSAALSVRDALADHAEYQIYKQLIGFEGIFGDWEELRRSESAWDYTDTKRRAAARQYVDEIDEDSNDSWRERILEFSKTRSDDLATFPVYYEFLEVLGREKPRMALELVTVHENAMDTFIIPIVAGLWASARQGDIESIVQRWIGEGAHLTAIAKSLYKGGAARLDTLSSVVARSVELDDRNALINAMGVAASLYAQGCEPAKAVFMKALRALAQHNDANWSSAVWFSRDFRSLVGKMDVAERAEVLVSMAPLPEVNYQAEEVLFAIGEQDTRAVLDYLMGRLRLERAREAQHRTASESELDEGSFESIPYHLHRLNQLLAKVPDELVAALRRDFDEGIAATFPYRGGARLMKSVFPAFEAPIEALLLKFVESGNQDDLNFALAVVRAYGGSAPILQVCKAIVKAVPEESSSWNELAVAIESTGVVMGEHGMARAFEHKRDEISAWMDDEHPRVRAFAKWLAEGLDQLITQERKRADEGLALRKYRYGVGKGDA